VSLKGPSLGCFPSLMVRAPDLHCQSMEPSSLGHLDQKGVATDLFQHPGTAENRYLLPQGLERRKMA
jgi:hypothetical protein